MVNELTAFIPGNFRFTFVEDSFQKGIEIAIAHTPFYVLLIAIFINQEAREKYGFWSVHMERISRKFWGRVAGYQNYIIIRLILINLTILSFGSSQILLRRLTLQGD